MWTWLTVNGIWVLVIASAILLVVIFGAQLIQLVALKLARRTSPEVISARTRRVLWVTGWVVLAVIIIALAAVITSRQGMQAVVTTETIRQWFLQHGIFILIILLVGVGLWNALGNFLPPLVQRATTRPAKGESAFETKKRTDTLTGIFMGVAKIVIVAIVASMILSELNVAIGPILAGIGVAGIAVGFGAQYLVRDLIAGIFILMENQYRVGDVANVAGISGLVEEVNLRKTVLRDLDGTVHHVPNGEIKVASNLTRQFARVNLTIPVAYDADIEQAVNVINRLGKEMAQDPAWKSKIISPPQVLGVDSLSTSGIELRILGDVRPIEQWAIMRELRKRIIEAFSKEGVEIPDPRVMIFGSSPQNKSAICHACSHLNLPGSQFCSKCGAKL